MAVDLVIVYLKTILEVFTESFATKWTTYKATSTNSSPHWENPMSIAPKNDVGATFLIAVENESLTRCLPVQIR